MLSKKNRIHKTDFRSFGRGVSFHSPLLSLFVYKKKDLSASQFSFSCSKKVSKSAVKRNLLRRRGYNSVGRLLKDIQPGFYCVFSFKKAALNVTFENIDKEVKSLLKISHVLG